MVFPITNDRVHRTNLTLQVGKVLRMRRLNKNQRLRASFDLSVVFHLPEGEMVPRMNARIL